MIINSVICIKGSLGKASRFVAGLYYFYCCRDMAYRPNFGGGYEPSYNSPNALGFSNVSRNLKQASFRNNNFEDHGGLGEVQFMLENERHKFRQTKQKLEADLDNQRKRRIQFENKLIKLKDEFSRKEVALSEAEFKINNLLHQNQDLAVNNDRLKHELARLEELYGSRIHELETQLNMETKNFEETTLQYNEEFDKFKKEGQEYVEQLTFEMERKIKNLEQKHKAAEMTKRDLSMENKKLNDLLISNRLQFEEQLRDTRNKARDEEIKKAQYLTKSFESKIRMVEDGKEGLNRKVQELIRLVQDKESKIAEMERDYEDENAKLRQDRADNIEQINQLNYLLSKVKSELADKDNLIGRSMTGNDSEVKMLKQQLEMKNKENGQLQVSLKQMRARVGEVEADADRKKRELADRCYTLETESRRYKDQYIRLAEMLKSKINSTIDNVSAPPRR